MQSSTALEVVLKRDRLIVLGGLVGITALAWAYTGYLAWSMDCMTMAMPHMQTWGGTDLVLLFVMWTVMMVAMMVPSAAPMILLFTTINRRRREQQQPYVPTAVFLGGYLLVWAGFSILATLAQWGLHSAALLSPMMVSTSPILGIPAARFTCGPTRPRIPAARPTVTSGQATGTSRTSTIADAHIAICRAICIERNASVQFRRTSWPPLFARI